MAEAISKKWADYEDEEDEDDTPLITPTLNLVTKEVSGSATTPMSTKTAPLENPTEDDEDQDEKYLKEFNFPSSAPYTMLVNNLPFAATEDDIDDFFSRNSESKTSVRPEHIHIIREQNGQTSGKCIVRFSSLKELQSAVLFRNIKMMGRPLKFFVNDQPQGRSNRGYGARDRSRERRPDSRPALGADSNNWRDRDPVESYGRGKGLSSSYHNSSNNSRRPQSNYATSQNNNSGYDRGYGSGFGHSSQMEQGSGARKGRSVEEEDEGEWTKVTGSKKPVKGGRSDGVRHGGDRPYSKSATRR